MIPAVASSSVAGSRSRMMSVTGLPWVQLLPRSPLSSDDMYIAYWTSTGLSRPSVARIASTSASVASSGSMT